MGLSLPVHLSLHLTLSLLAGVLVWRIWKKPFASIVGGIIGGVFVDFDHFIDYYLAFGFSWKLDYFRNGYQFLMTDKIYVLFHAWEYVIILALIAFVVKNKIARSFIAAVALGLFFHLLTDVVVDDMPFRSYSLKYRIENNFELKQLVKPENYIQHLEKKRWVEFAE